MAIKTASVLAFERKLANSDALMFAGKWDDINGGVWQPIHIQEKAVRGTISNRLKNAIASDPAKLDAEIQKANLQRVDVAALPMDADTLKVTFTLRVLGHLSTPSVCNDREYQVALQDVIEGISRSMVLPNWLRAMQKTWLMVVSCGATALVLKLLKCISPQESNAGRLMHNTTVCVNSANPKVICRRSRR